MGLTLNSSVTPTHSLKQVLDLVLQSFLPKDGLKFKHEYYVQSFKRNFHDKRKYVDGTNRIIP